MASLVAQMTTLLILASLIQCAPVDIEKDDLHSTVSLGDDVAFGGSTAVTINHASGILPTLSVWVADTYTPVYHSLPAVDMALVAPTPSSPVESLAFTVPSISQTTVSKSVVPTWDVSTPRTLPQPTARPASSVDATKSLQISQSYKAIWTQPTSLTNLSSDFGVSNFAWGTRLATIISAVPSAAFSPLQKGDQKMASPSAEAASGDVIAVLYPSGSANPAARPQGGLGFYASPLDITHATNVSLGYSVLFPAGFDWVKGGKLPGLYGGHGGCSGGASASNCFSTRLMWRQDGAGELYLYAPRHQPSKRLCSTPPLTYCDSAFGDSIGRGSFNFSAGSWTDVRQDIWLNTPGKDDGGFNLWIDGRLAVSSHQVLYRNSPALPSAGPGASPSTSAKAAPTTTKTSDSLLGIIGDLGQDLLSPLAYARRSFVDIGQLYTLSTTSPARSFHPDSSASGFPASAPVDNVIGIGDGLLGGLLAAIPQPSRSSMPVSSKRTSSLPPAASLAAPAADSLYNGDAFSDRTLLAKPPIGFQGMMFDTFFGGKAEDGYASPYNQSAYFAKVWMAINS